MGTLKLLITGASGYLGRQTVARATAAGHEVIAVIRDRTAVLQDWPNSVEFITTDLNSLTAFPKNVDVVLHLAASMDGDDTAQQHDTVGATKALLTACLSAHTPPALVLASSLSVYSGVLVQENDVIDENSPLDDRADQRDAYCRAKIAQEMLCATVAADAGLPLQILRIGAIYGPGRVWNAHIGVGLGPVLLRIGNSGEIPLCHVGHAAQALVLAAEQAAQGVSSVVNVVDSDLPDRNRFVSVLKRGGWPKLSATIPWRMLEATARYLGRWNGRPGLLRLPVLRARMMPLRYSNQRLQDMGWQPEADFEMLMQKAMEDGHD
ncbi:dTDP-4-dehydro-6-deoxyglucose reductase [Thalassovita gelatinovora]|uniref:dTDP-4-dehydro-6-deoxyglucose reductase n=1 Tax=Thalassovita gelatinovora TaxID=53501 RepID=A0A0P1FS50_THAGE|nr:NAD(P)-dependent oxidoreductase [Thalassovita gelatinovora]QIZ81174.1 NAD(P)-dependent oxidoreductase [Thalassovita gelatinovora]CUH64774.1 dTDP-4-dehydro-6-deoxyglucose reductase [Thalassovita gelatinovora]SEP92294.1 Nucleoside-diphosphate-sugar epimerase [Thalassovita gelatinovora]